MHSDVSTIFDDGLQVYARYTDYAEVFIDQMNGLYLLSFLVTADGQIAEKCFSTALDEYMKGRQGFLDWAKEDGRRAVIRHAVQLLQPAPKQACQWSYPRIARHRVLAGYEPFAAITSLSSFERFVFVMSVIECLSEEKCAVLLDCGVQEVAIARQLAFEMIEAADINFDLTGEMQMSFEPILLGHQRCGLC